MLGFVIGLIAPAIAALHTPSTDRAQRSWVKFFMLTRWTSLCLTVVGTITGVSQSWGEWDYVGAYMLGGPMFYPGRHQLAFSGLFIMLLFFRQLFI